METENRKTPSHGHGDIMMRIASFVVNKRHLFLVFFLLACIYSVFMISKVEVINELTEYLPETTETRQGLDIMDEEFDLPFMDIHAGEKVYHVDFDA